MAQTGLTSVSEAQHEELVTGGDAYGSAGIVEDVTEFRDFETNTAGDEPGRTSNSGGTGGTGPDLGSNKAALAIGALAIGAIVLGGTQ